MRYFVLFLLLLNIVVFMLPKPPQQTVHSYTRGVQNVPMLVLLDEKAEAPEFGALVQAGFINEQPAQEADQDLEETDGSETDVTSVAQGEQNADTGTAATDEDGGSEASAQTTGDKESSNTDQEDEAALAKIKSQGNFDKAGDEAATPGIAAVEPPAQGVKRGKLRCFSLGPFRDRETVNELMAAMVKKGVKPELRIDKVKEPSAYWVYLPPYPSREEAAETAARLELMGFDDFFIVGEPKYNNAISLGLFSRKEGSRKRVRDLKEMGFSAKVETRYADRDVFWIDYTTHGKPNWKPLLRKYKVAGEVKNVKRDCD